jgi:hypothetical protein
MKKTLVLVLVLAILSAVALYAEKPSATVALIKSGITADGSLADWKALGIAPLVINKKSQVAVGPLKWENQSANVYVAVSGDTLYIAAEVTNPKGPVNKNVDGKIYDGDCVELFIGFDNSDPSRELYTETDYQVGFSSGDYSKANRKFKVKPMVYCFNTQKPVTDAKIVVKATATGYIMEAAVPGSFFSGWDVRDGMDIGFDIGLDDIGSKGAVRKIQMTWSGDPDGWKNPKGWGKASIKAKK